MYEQLLYIIQYQISSIIIVSRQQYLVLDGKVPWLQMMGLIQFQFSPSFPGLMWLSILVFSSLINLGVLEQECNISSVQVPVSHNVVNPPHQSLSQQWVKEIGVKWIACLDLSTMFISRNFCFLFLSWTHILPCRTIYPNIHSCIHAFIHAFIRSFIHFHTHLTYARSRGSSVYPRHSRCKAEPSQPYKHMMYIFSSNEISLFTYGSMNTFIL